MRINLNCPFADKDQAKALGARWDAARRVWYIVDMEDLTPFMQWIDNPRLTGESKDQPRITLADYQFAKYAGRCHALSFKAALAFGIPYPLESGWFKKHKSKTALVSALEKADEPKPHGKKSKSAKPAPQAVKDAVVPQTTGGKMVPSCDCKALPWDDCEHTPAYLAFRDSLLKEAMKSTVFA